MKSKDVLWGLVLVVAGLLILASNLGTLPEINFARLWPVVFVVIGISKMITPDEGDSPWGGLVFIFMAGIFLAHNYHVLRLKDSWPLFIVVGGLSLLLSANGCRKDKERKTA
jgi:hypothetical protein